MWICIEEPCEGLIVGGQSTPVNALAKAKWGLSQTCRSPQNAAQSQCIGMGLLDLLIKEPISGSNKLALLTFR